MVTSTQRGIRIDSKAPATVTAMTTNNAPGSLNRWVQTNSTPPAMAPPAMVPPSSPNTVSRELTRTRSMVGGITLGVTALRSTLNDLENTIMASAHG